jgi:carnitine O-acetyltransferase
LLSLLFFLFFTDTFLDRQAIVLNEDTSYVRPFWNNMYLEGRYPIPINSNPVLIFPIDSKHSSQESRAANVVHGFLQFWFAKVEHRLPPDEVNGRPQCMDEYERLFSSSRIPQSGSDRWHEQTCCELSRHIVILRGPCIYKLDVITEDGVIPEASLRRILKEHILDRDSQDEGEGDSYFLGDFTALERNEWASVRSTMVQQSVTTSASIDCIDDALFVLGLDVESAVDDDDFISVGLHGGHRNGRQEHRWYDKTCVNVDPEGRCSYNFEHSMYDGAAMRRLCDEMWAIAQNLPTGRAKWSFKNSSLKNEKSWTSTLQQLQFELSEDSRAAMQAAGIFHHKNQSSVNIVQATFKKYGKSVMKTFNTSPDGILQAAFKWTYARMHGWTQKSPFVYESCQTKGFLCGRTEVIRTTTTASNAFVGYMMDCEARNVPVEKSTAAQLLRASADKHSEVARAASQADGVDRHLFSLLRIAQARGAPAAFPLPSLFTDAAWALSNASILSTSNLSSEAFHGMGFGPVVSQGYGIAYGINNDALYFGVSNFVQNDTTDDKKVASGFGGVAAAVENIHTSLIPTDSVKFREELFRSLEQIRDLFEEK